MRPNKFVRRFFQVKTFLKVKKYHFVKVAHYRKTPYIFAQLLRHSHYFHTTNKQSEIFQNPKNWAERFAQSFAYTVFLTSGSSVERNLLRIKRRNSVSPHYVRTSASSLAKRNKLGYNIDNLHIEQRSRPSPRPLSYSKAFYFGCNVNSLDIAY